MRTEPWVADRAQLQHLLHEQPEWTHKELAAWVGRSLGWVKKWVKRLRDAPANDISVLFGLPRGRRTPYPQIDPLVEERILAIRESPPEHLQRVPGPKAILYYLARDAELLEHALPLPRSTRTIWKVLRRHGCIVRPVRLPPQPLERPAPMSAWQLILRMLRPCQLIPMASSSTWWKS
jgi:hypothetical protein